MPYEALDRSSLAYHAQRYESLIDNTELALADRVASFLLAIVWSCGVAGVGNVPHEASYSTYTSTRPSDMTVPGYANVALSRTSATVERPRCEPLISMKVSASLRSGMAIFNCP